MSRASLRTGRPEQRPAWTARLRGVVDRAAAAPHRARRHADVPLEGAAERRLGLVAETARDLAEAGAILAQPARREVHAPARQVEQRRRAHQRREAIREHRARHVDAGRERRRPSSRAPAGGASGRGRRPTCGSRSAPSQPVRSSAPASIHERTAWMTRMSASRSITVVPPGRGFSASLPIAVEHLPQQVAPRRPDRRGCAAAPASARPADAPPDPRSGRRRRRAPCARRRRRGAAASCGRRPSRRAARGRCGSVTSTGARRRCARRRARRARSRPRRDASRRAARRCSQASPSATKWNTAWSSAGMPRPHGAVSSLWQ